MASEIKRLRLEHATALVKERTARLELHARLVQLLCALVGLATASISVLGALLIVLRI
ncbi:MAG: hypothetical protein ACJ76D_02780 [Solirubrobacterales bacterium]